MSKPIAPAFLRLKQVIDLTGMSRATIYAKSQPGHPSFDPTFPRRVRLGARTVAWSAADLANWASTRVAVQDEG